MDTNDYMNRAYEEYFESLAEGEEALGFNEFVNALSTIHNAATSENKYAASF
ncbi:TPA: hypothetical protein ACJG67_002824 [Salmonella enterica subsp. enterica serovar Kottbus]